MKYYIVVTIATIVILSSTARAARDEAPSVIHGLVETGSVINNPRQFMTIPLSSSRLEHNNIAYTISEGWFYNSQEKGIHGITNHKSVDYAVPHGTPVYSPVDGFIQGSYYNTTLGSVGDRHQYQGSSINYGLGYWVQIIYPDPTDPLNPDKVTFIQLAHLSRFSPEIKETIQGLDYIFDPVEDAMKINNYSLSYTQLAFILRGMHTRIIPVKQGDLIGYAGTSGLEKGEEVDASYVPRSYIYDAGNSRDESHIHMQIYSRSSEGYKLSSSITDPYYLSGAQSDQYPSHDNGGVLTSGHVFKSMDGKLPDYAK